MKASINEEEIKKIIDDIIPDAEAMIKSANSALYMHMQKLNNEIKVRHPWGKNRTMNLRSKHIFENPSLLKFSIISGAEYSSALYYGRKAFFLKPRRKKALSWSNGADRFYSKGHMIGSITGKPWIEEAYKLRESKILSSIADAMIKVK